MKRALVVSIHDVAPHTWARTEEILHDLAPLGIDRCSLLVVPNHHHRGNILADDAFCEALRNWEKRGHEIVAHGYLHIRETKPAEGLISRLINRSYTAGEGEFYDLSRDDAAELLRRAREDFAAAGIHPMGFIAPAWLLSSDAEAALREAGWLYTTRLGSMLKLSPHQEWKSQSLVYSVRSAWRREVSLRWNPFLYRRLATNPLLRMSIHPPDFSHPRIEAQILDLLRVAVRSRTPQTYAEFVQAAAV